MNVAIDEKSVVSGDRNEIRLPLFEGPMDLLLHLIRKNEIDIYDIPIALITEQYLGYLHAMKELNITLAGEFLEMAATLILIKSRMMLPPDPEMAGSTDPLEDPRAELVQQIVEYEKVKTIAQTLYSRQELEQGMWSSTRIQEVLPEEDHLVSVTLYDLIEAFRDVLKRVEARVIMEVERESVSVAEKIALIRQYLIERKKISFRRLLMEAPSRRHLVATFIAILELVRLGEIITRQADFFGEILILRRTRAS